MANHERNRPRGRGYEEIESESGMGLILAAVACFGLALVTLYICVAALQPNTVMSALRDILRGLGGSVSLVLALEMVWIGILFVAAYRGKHIQVWRVIVNVLLFLCFFTAVQLFSVEKIPMSIHTYVNFIGQSYSYGSGGGFLGALLAWPLYCFGGVAGGLVVLLVVVVLCLTATGRMRQLFDLLNAGSEKRREKKRERDLERQKQQEREEEERRRLQEQEYIGRQRRPVQGTGRPGQNGARRPAPGYGGTRPASSGNSARSDNSKGVIIGGTGGFSTATVSEEPPRPRRTKSTRVYNADPAAEQPVDSTAEGELEIPKPLRKLKEERKSRAAKQQKPADTVSDDLFEVHSEAPADIPKAAKAKDEPKVIDTSDSFKPVNYSTGTPAKPKVVIEGVRPVAIDNDPPAKGRAARDEDDEPPFDVPQRVDRGPKLRRPEPTPVDEDGYNYPPIDLLAEGKPVKQDPSGRNIDQQRADTLIRVLQEFGVQTSLTGIAHGPAVTRYELQPAPGVKVSRITSLADDLALNLAAKTIRIEAPIPGKPAVGIEIPNDHVETVSLRDVLESREARSETSKIAVGFGKDNAGRYIVGNIAKMPHVLIAGQTGSGKSVCINSIITSVLYRAAPEDVRMILIDPKVVELQVYNEIPHLIAPVVTDPKKAASALQWAVSEMERRYKAFADHSVRDLKGYNKQAKANGEETMPQILIIIDELADLMMVAARDVEDSICRLAQLARAAGMHLIIATQRPSVDVITGIIKANIPSRIAFNVSSATDSATIIGHGGAEKLLGNGDMLYFPSGINKPIRVQGAWVSDEEVIDIVGFIKARTEPNYDEDVRERIDNAVRSDAEKEEVQNDFDPKLAEAIEIAVEMGQTSTSMLQRKMRVGYARAGRLIDEMERRGVVSPADGSKPRDVLINREQMERMFDNSPGEETEEE